jgi:hypothetical protein
LQKKIIQPVLEMLFRDPISTARAGLHAALVLSRFASGAHDI